MQPSKPHTSRASSHESAYEAIKRDLIQFRFKPGERLIEETLSDRYGVSRTPIREALRRLEEEGLVQSHGVGRFVRHFDVREFEDIYRVRAAVERLAAVQASERGSDEAIAALREGWEADGSSGGYDRADERFHVGIAGLAGNAYLSDWLQRINDRIWVIRMMDFSSDERIAITRREHAEILDVIVARDAVAAGELMHAHIQDAMSNVKALVSQALTHIYLDGGGDPLPTAIGR